MNDIQIKHLGDAPENLGTLYPTSCRLLSIRLTLPSPELIITLPSCLTLLKSWLISETDSPRVDCHLVTFPLFADFSHFNVPELCYFPRAATINYHNLSDLKQQQFILVTGLEPEVPT